MPDSPLKIAAYTNCDDAAVFWRVEQAIPGCVGFALERQTRQGPDAPPLRSFVENRTGFASHPGKPGEHRPSTEWPFQRFSWTDHVVDLGDRVSYRVIPIIESPPGQLNLAADLASGWTEELVLSGDTDPNYSFFFNRGLVISQFMARYLAALNQKTPGETMTQTLKKFKNSLDEHEQPIRLFLAGELGKALLGLLARTKDSGGHAYAALYELSDGELIEALKALADRAHVVLSDGSTKAVGDDENKAARASLKAAGVEVHDRMVKPGINAHNKFLVLCDAQKTPRSVWTGSTNWTATGLCTQINNGLHIIDDALAAHYRKQWDRLRDAGNDFPDDLVTANGAPATFPIGPSQATVWFSRTQHGADMDALRKVVADAKEGILFLMFMPGATGVLASIRERMAAAAGADLYVHGVVSTLPAEGDESHVRVETVAPGRPEAPVELNVVQPEGIAHAFAGWAETVTRPEFAAIGRAIVHSKVLVIDPFTNPVVVTGSHNFSSNASLKNDENFVIVRGNGLLAHAYAVHVLAVYQHYRWLAYVNDQQKAGKDPWSGLAAGSDWQQGYLAGPRRREMVFWVR
jgi:PLD-like domain